MTECWKEKTAERPLFGDIVHHLEAIILPVAPELPEPRQLNLGRQHNNGNYMNAAYKPDKPHQEYLELMRMSTPAPHEGYLDMSVTQ